VRSKNENIKITLKDLESLPCLFALSINGQYVIAFWKVAHDPFAHLNDNLTGWTNGFFMFR
jgi:hypothetical protein